MPEQHAEVRRRQDHRRGGGERFERTGHLRSYLREPRRTRRGVELRKGRLEGALVTS